MTIALAGTSSLIVKVIPVCVCADVVLLLGELTIRGADLHINKIDVDMGELELEGEISSMSYTDNRPRKGGMLSRFFG